MLYQTKNPHGGDIYDGEVELDFSANTNPFGTPRGVIRAVTDSLQNMHRYPDPYCRELIRALAEFEGVEESWLLCGNGAADLIYAYCQAVRPRTAAEPAPTFSEYALGLARVGCRPEQYLLKQEEDFRITEAILPWLEEKRPEVLFLCNPNNPTGQLTDPELMEKIVETTGRLGIRLFVDECFLDLSDGGVSLRGMLGDNPHLFLLKAFTKSYGMAGIRRGYCLCSDPRTLGAMAQASQPWNLSSLAQAAGIAALKETEFLEQTRQLISREREILRRELQGFGFWVSDSRTNFLLFRGPEGLDQSLRRRHIAIRSCGNYVGLDSSWYRTAVRLPEENRALLDAISECL